MSDEYRRRLCFIRKRGEHCVLDKSHKDDCGRVVFPRSSLCGCGSRTPPSVKYRRRIVRRTLKAQLHYGDE